MKSTIMSSLAAMLLAVSLSAQAARPAPANPQEIAGRWIGSVTADAGEMSIGLDLKAVDGKVSGTLETAHGNWTVESATSKEGRWILVVRMDDGAEGRMTGQVKGGSFAGDWDFKPRAVGTFQLARPQR